MCDSPVNCCLCLRDIEKSYERLILERCSKDFDILAEIESFEISPLDSKYICRQCVAKLKKRRGLLIQKGQVESELKNICEKAKRAGESLENDVDATAAKRAELWNLRVFLYDNVIAINYLFDDIWVLFVSNSDRWHSIVVEKKNLVFY